MLSSGFRAFPRAAGGVVHMHRTLLPSLASSATASFSGRRTFASKVFFDIAIDGEKHDRMEFELYDDVVPKTTKNFRELCTGEHGFGYKNCKFHRVIPQFMCQGGDFTSGDGRGGKSIYGDRFADENFDKRHSKPGLLSMANAGKNTNGSQFFITFRDTPHLDGNHVVFGEVTSGQSTLNAIEQQGSYSGKPQSEIEITDCGVVE